MARGVEVGSALGVGLAITLGVGVAITRGVGVANTRGVGVDIGFGVGKAIASAALGSGDPIGSRVGVGIVIGWSVNVSVGSGGGVARGRAVGAGEVVSPVTGLLLRKGVEAASCAHRNGAAVRNTVAIATKRMVFFRLSPWAKFVARS
jgi:hypothetical protein